MAKQLTTIQQWYMDMMRAGCSSAEVTYFEECVESKTMRGSGSLMTNAEEVLRMKQTGVTDAEIYHFLAL